MCSVLVTIMQWAAVARSNIDASGALNFLKNESNSTSLSCVPQKMMCLLKLPFNQNLIMIYQKSNDDFKSHIILRGIQGRFLALLDEWTFSHA